MKSEFYSRYFAKPTEGLLPFAVRSLGYNFCASGYRFREMQKKHPRDHWFDRKRGRVLDTLTICFVTRGHGFYVSEMAGDIEVFANSVVLVFPGVRHSFRYDEKVGWDSQWVEIEATVALPILARAGIAPDSPVRRFGTLSTLSGKFLELIDASRPKGSSEVVLAASAYRILAEVVSVWSTGSCQPSRQEKVGVVEAAKKYLSGANGKMMDVAQTARAVGLGESRFREVFRAQVGLSPKQYQLNLRIARSKTLLAETKMSVSAVAEANGFDSIYAFSRQFRRSTGVSPLAYRTASARKTGRRKC